MARHNNKPFRWYPIVSVAIICGLIGFSIFTFRARKARDKGVVLAQDVARLSCIFAQIDATAGIGGFDFQKNEINFLNVKKDGFVGSEVGSMNLIRPARWEGPYVNEVSSLQEQNYMIVRTQQGYFITPRDGVRLPNGKEVGKDILLDENADIEAMMQDDSLLAQNGTPLAAKITISGTASASSDACKVVQMPLPEDEE
jgi:hypothetical protein